MKKTKHFVLMLCCIFCSLAGYANTVTYYMDINGRSNTPVQITSRTTNVTISDGNATIRVTVSTPNACNNGMVVFRLSGHGKSGTMASTIQRDNNGFYLIVERADLYHGLQDGTYTVELMPQK